MLDFEAAGDRNSFIDLQKLFLEIKCKIVHASASELKYDAGAAADVKKQTLLSFVMMFYNNFFLTVQHQPTDWKFQMQIKVLLTKISLKTKFPITKMQRLLAWLAKVNRTRINLEQ